MANVVGQVLSAGTNVIYSNGPTGTTPTSSATASVSVLYVGTTRMSSFRVGMGVIKKMPEDFEN